MYFMYVWMYFMYLDVPVLGRKILPLSSKSFITNFESTSDRAPTQYLCVSQYICGVWNVVLFVNSPIWLDWWINNIMWSKSNMRARELALYQFFLWPGGPTRTMTTSVMRFLDHTRQLTVGRIPLDEWSAHRRDHYLTKHNTHIREMFMLPARFEPAISTG